MVDIALPEKMRSLFTPSRYKIYFGGRGGGKSHSVAKALLVQGMQAKQRVLCAREFQNSITDSVHKLLADQIMELGLEWFYEIQKTTIKGRNGTEFLFAGLKHNVTSIKSFEGCTRVWVEEAQTVSKASWDVLVPTIRKPESEIWVTFNPLLEDDETYKRFIKHPPPDAIVERVNWYDNPWFPDVLRKEMLHLKATDPDAFLHVWEGHCRQTLDGAIYANELRAATEEQRITRVPYDRAKPVHTFWDLGRSDNTSIWFAQVVGFEFRVIDFYQSRGHALAHYLGVLQERKYNYGEVWLPHDATHELLASELTIEQQVRAHGYTVRVAPRLSIADGINAARTIFGKCYFDADKTADGLNCLRHYRYDVDPDTKAFSKHPLHDWASHAADAFRYLAVGMENVGSGFDRDEDDYQDDSWSRGRSATGGY